ncbi:hypothetical protein TRVA0_068S00144 [Trichomonascus vanleenenianus]|uniref:uncharacterized protein n=1 Tax=Trichomonascus vanleenenianus TaxID=2268995 RepID=UPI003ECACBFE
MTGRSFSSCFWSPDYLSGVGVIFDKLQQGCAENVETLSMVSDRIVLETSFATGLQAFPQKHAPSLAGFDRDEGATLRQAYVSYMEEIKSQGLIHAEIAAKLEKGVRGPFQKWSASHKSRVSTAQSTLTGKIKAYNKRLAQVQKAQQQYFSKCRQLEDTDGTIEAGGPQRLSLTEKLHKRASSLFSDGALSIPSSSISEETLPETEETVQTDVDDGSVELAGTTYSPEQLARLLDDMLRDIPRADFKVAILGTYENVSTGDEIVLWARKRLNCKNVGRAEKFGQSLVDNGLLKAVGRVGQKFVNSSSSGYQWTKKAIDYDPNALFPESNNTLPQVSITSPPASAISEYFTGLLQPTSNAPTTNKEISKIHQEIAEADERYQAEVIELDLERCELERTIAETLRFMEQCELDRLKALKTVLSDFVASISTPMAKAPGVMKRMHAQKESVKPESDLSYMIESYKTSTFAPRVVIYESFHSAAKCQTFGVDLHSVPFVVPTFLNYFEEQTEAPLTIQLWIEQAPLASIHQLRNQINSGIEFDPWTILPSFPLHVVVSTFKEFLLELQDSIISFTMYDVFKKLYRVYGTSEDKQQDRLERIAAALSHTARSTVTVLESLINHLALLIESPPHEEHNGEEQSEEDVATSKRKLLVQVSVSLAPYFMRPKQITGATMVDKHPAWLMEDLITHREHIFTTTYARISAAMSQSQERNLAMSEANRRANMEARNREILERSRAARDRAGADSPNSSEGRTAGGTHSHTNSVKSSSGLLPLALSPSRFDEGNTSVESFVSDTTPSRQTHLRHQKSMSTPIKSPLLTPASGTRSPDSGENGVVLNGEARRSRSRGRSFNSNLLFGGISRGNTPKPKSPPATPGTVLDATLAKLEGTPVEPTVQTEPAVQESTVQVEQTRQVDQAEQMSDSESVTTQQFPETKVDTEEAELSVPIEHVPESVEHSASVEGKGLGIH